MATTNEALDIRTRIQLAKEWLQEYENETIAAAVNFIFAIYYCNMICSAYQRKISGGCTIRPGGDSSLP
jgi:hypothetical protein